MKQRRKFAVWVLALSLMGGTGSALAATPSSQQYGNPGGSEPTSTLTPPATPTQNGQIVGSVKAAPPTVGVAGEGTLPFTGQNVALVVGVGGALVLAGLGLRRAGRNKQ